MKLFLVLLVLVTSCGCGSTTSVSSFAKPEDTIHTFVSAAIDKNAEAMSECVADETGSMKFTKEIVRGLKDVEIEQLAELMVDYQIIGQQTDEKQSVVDVKYKSKSDQIRLVKSADGWKITDI